MMEGEGEQEKEGPERWREDEVKRKSVLMIMACREKAPNHKNGKWGP